MSEELERLRRDLTRAVGLNVVAGGASGYTFGHIMDVIKDCGVSSQWIYYEHAAKLMAAYLDRISSAAEGEERK